MIARIYYNIPRHHGKYGIACQILDETKLDEFGCKTIVDYFKTYKFQTEDGCDIEAQERDLRKRVEKKYPGIKYWGE